MQDLHISISAMKPALIICRFPMLFGFLDVVDSTVLFSNFDLALGGGKGVRGQFSFTFLVFSHEKL